MGNINSSGLSSANPGLVKAARLLVLQTLEESPRPMSLGEIGKVTEVGEHYAGLALLTLEEEAKVMKYKGHGDGRGSAPFVYRLPTETERRAIMVRRALAAKVHEALGGDASGASVTIHGVTASLDVIAAALGISAEPTAAK